MGKKKMIERFRPAAGVTLLLLTVLLGSACEEPSEPSPAAFPIRFAAELSDGVSVSTEGTRADPVTTPLLIYGIYELPPAEGSETPWEGWDEDRSVINSQLGMLSPTADPDFYDVTYSPTYYRADQRYNYKFRMVSPARHEGIQISGGIGTTPPRITIDITAREGEQPDLMVAFGAREAEEAKNTPVYMEFRHMLAKLIFRVTDYDYDPDGGTRAGSSSLYLDKLEAFGPSRAAMDILPAQEPSPSYPFGTSHSTDADWIKTIYEKPAGGTGIAVSSTPQEVGEVLLLPMGAGLFTEDIKYVFSIALDLGGGNERQFTFALSPRRGGLQANNIYRYLLQVSGETVNVIEVDQGGGSGINNWADDGIVH